ncbi:MAG: 50S ribosomal protein L20 [bacterium]
MARVKRGMIHLKKRSNMRKRAKGFLWGRKKNIKQMHIAVIKSGVQAYKGRKLKKRDYRAVHTIKVNAGARAEGLSYSKFIDALHKKGIELDRKSLSVLADKFPVIFKQIVAAVK